MAQHLTSAQIQTLLARTVSTLKPFEVRALDDALNRVPHNEGGDTAAGAQEVTLATIFPNGGLNP